MVEQVAENIIRICVPIPFPLRTVNIYALVGKDGWALFDAAIGTEEARTAVQEGLQGAGLQLEELRAIVLSHAHPDHIGLSGEFQTGSGAAVYMHPIDEAQLHRYWRNERLRVVPQVSQFFKAHGMPPDPTLPHEVPLEVMRRIINLPPHEAFTLVEDGQEIELVGERYRVFWVPGHSDGHICLFRERDGVFLAADHVLPRITPNVGLYSEYNRANPLGDYLDSLRKVEHLPASIVLPGHGDPFSDLAGRVRELIEHHAEREGEILHLLANRPQDAYQLAKQLFGQRLKSQDSWRMAVAETLSHLEYMRIDGLVARQQTDNGLILYSR
ncbi:MAG TPA: MBL fold metallo-hydrolase [Ktedonobacteraceae bacterium]|nr:MBL fold metallo-hydrolase [Ktedonobacteraceae bacterium]